MWIVLLGVQLIPKCDNVCPSAKESEDKENLPKRTSAGGFKFTFSHSASTANGANSANSKSVAAQTSPASSNGSSSKSTALSPAVPAPKVGELVWGCPGEQQHLPGGIIHPGPCSESLTAPGRPQWGWALLVQSHPTCSASFLLFVPAHLLLCVSDVHRKLGFVGALLVPPGWGIARWFRGGRCSE